MSREKAGGGGQGEQARQPSSSQVLAGEMAGGVGLCGPCGHVDFTQATGVGYTQNDVMGDPYCRERPLSLFVLLLPVGGPTGESDKNCMNTSKFLCRFRGFTGHSGSDFLVWSMSPPLDR